jgi:hypothetical protein
MAKKQVISERVLGFLYPQWLKMKVYKRIKKYPSIRDSLVAKRCSRHKEQNPDCRRLK